MGSGVSFSLTKYTAGPPGVAEAADHLEPVKASPPRNPSVKKHREPTPKLSDHHTLGKSICQSDSAVIYSCTSKDTNDDQEYAVKKVDLDVFGLTHFKNEFEMLRSCNHPNLVKAHHMFNEQGCFGIIVMDLYVCNLGQVLNGGQGHGRKSKSSAWGDYVDTTESRGSIRTEKSTRSTRKVGSAKTGMDCKLAPATVAQLVRQLGSAIQYTHSKGIVHANVKPESCLLDTFELALGIPDAECNVVLGGFSQARYLDAGGRLFGGRKQNAFWSPERLTSTYAHKADVWALGVCALGLAVGHVPTESDICGMSLKPCDPGFADFMTGMLNTNERARFSADDLVEHTWLSDGVAAMIWQ